MKKYNLIVVNSFFLFSLTCIGFPGIVNRDGKIFFDKVTKGKIVYSGFTKYEEEQNEISKLILASGFKEDPKADLLLEVTLEELDAKYKRRYLHFFNLIFSIGTITLFPYHNLTEHRLTFKLRNEGIVTSELVLNTKFHQWRGLTLLPISYFYWPTTEFREYLKKMIYLELTGKE
jgi:hypothetical protein